MLCKKILPLGSVCPGQGFGWLLLCVSLMLYLRKNTRGECPRGLVEAAIELRYSYSAAATSAGADTIQRGCRDSHEKGVPAPAFSVASLSWGSGVDGGAFRLGRGLSDRGSRSLFSC